MWNANTDISPAERGRIWCEKGQALAEYALILAAVSIMAVGLTPVGQWCAVRISELAGAL